ncbi:HNH endonuclease signature motif containing protein [Paenarthrobacter aurescens]|uniref:HNH endonuclease signature motif containing protein n=1 Tax=Paenarthrobacter aurescens TaxID=43663 RepID=UPI0021C0223F|nr:HNH endonuclease signature motif containing protein [Paenarthrobacter aurescens]MCT9868681.1 HNH endonuclease [Paenarthrobacter aurescens]
MEETGQFSALRAESSPAVAALTAVRSRRFLSRPELHKAGFKDSTVPVTWTGRFHGAGLPNSKAKSARASSLTGPAPADVSAQKTGSIPKAQRNPRTSLGSKSAQPVQRFDTQRPGPKASGGLNLTELLNDSAALLDSARLSASDEASLLGFVEAADFAGRVEEISRCVEYLQVVAAQAVERSRTEAQQTKPGSSAAAPEWRTGWTDQATGTTDPEATVPGAASVLDDGYRNAAEFLRARLRIGIGEARRRLALAAEVLPQTGMTGQEIPARREVLAAALSSALVPSRSASIISTALDKVRHLTDQDTIARMEHALTTTAVETDPDFVTKMAKRWADRIDQDGPEPTEEILRQFQGAFLRRRRRHGLHHLEIFATDEQYEILATAMNAATNPRLTTQGPKDTAGPDLDRRTRPQKHLNGLVGACSVAMSTGKLPSNGGLRPQLTVTIDHRDLFEHLTGTQLPDTDTTRNPLSTGTATFTGPIHPDTIRKIACDADIIPVLLGSDSRILDIGRTTRIFPPHIRKAITARDGGCAFPDCTIPAPWCEAHHTTYWSHGGTTSTNNGTLLCSHHHHLIHKEQWRINMTTGVPWFIPPPHLDPNQTPRRNHHHTPHRT